ncbi:MAG TPA: sigma-70 family RNA polymerase sigma factor [Polyangia bacterium]|jgi:RNA polymerase sigma-70 factor (ECF subfamily)
MTSTSTYVRFAPYVRRQLAALGVRDADLPDLCHEVFLVVHGKQGLPAVERKDLWLREICRRVAAGYRRRAGHRLEVLGSDVPERPDPRTAAADERDAAARLSLLRRALNHLDDESRDLVALHDVGEMPLSALARLVAHDRKTVRSRLERARRRLSRWLSGDGAPEAGQRSGAAAPRTTPPASAFMREQAARGRAAGCAPGELDILGLSPQLCSGALGNVAVSDWRGPQIDAATIESVVAAAPYTLERCGGEICSLAIIEPTMHPPALEVRQKVVDALEIVGPYFTAFAVVLLTANARINRPILEGLALLARPRFPMRFFFSFRAATAWLCATTARSAAGPLDPDELAAAAERVRQLDPDRGDERRHVRSLRAVTA